MIVRISGFRSLTFLSNRRNIYRLMMNSGGVAGVHLHKGGRNEAEKNQVEVWKGGDIFEGNIPSNRAFETA